MWHVCGSRGNNAGFWWGIQGRGHVVTHMYIIDGNIILKLVLKIKYEGVDRFR
jgi:hypothetical protein